MKLIHFRPRVIHRWRGMAKGVTVLAMVALFALSAQAQPGGPQPARVTRPMPILAASSLVTMQVSTRFKQLCTAPSSKRRTKIFRAKASECTSICRQVIKSAVSRIACRNTSPKRCSSFSNGTVCSDSSQVTQRQRKPHVLTLFHALVRCVSAQIA